MMMQRKALGQKGVMPTSTFHPKTIRAAHRVQWRKQDIALLQVVQATTTGSSSTALVVTGSRKDKVDNRETVDAQANILSCLSMVKGRGKSGLDEAQRASLEDAVKLLEANGGVADVTAQEGLLDGRWRLLFTSRPGTASPIQNTFTGVDAFSVFQDVDLSGPQPSIDNVVDFGPKLGYLRVQALASTDSRPLEGFTPRQGAGLPLFGQSFTYPAAKPNMRIDFQFDQAAFYFKFLPFTIPYPVPFRLLGDETKGWLDVTYLSPDGNFRLSRGNKGTLFILAKERQVKALLEAAIQAKDDEAVINLIQFMALDNPIKAPAQSEAASGKWRLVWSQQASNASPLQKFGSKQADSFQLIDGKAGSLQNVVQLLGGFMEIRAEAECSAMSATRTEVLITNAGISLGGLRVPLPVPKGGSNPGFIDWLYLDEDMRITRGSKGSLFIHTREEGSSSEESA